MKNIFIIGWLILCGCILGCHEEDIPKYYGSNHIQFVKDLTKDSTTVSFLYAPEATELDSFLIVKMTGRPYLQDMEYKISVDRKFTDMEEGTHYKLPENTFFKTGQLRDTLPITFYRTEEMKKKAFRLVLRVETNETFLTGQTEYCYKVFVVHDMISQPGWWTKEVTDFYLGTYSDTRYRYFLEATEGVDLTKATTSEIRAYALMFKYWIERQDKPITEDNGDKITLPVNG